MLKLVNALVKRVTNPLVLTDAEATRQGLKQYSHGTTYNGGIAPTVTPTTASSLVNGRFVPYQMQDGSWRMRLNITLTFNSPSTTGEVTINGVTFPAYNQAGGGSQTPGGGSDVAAVFTHGTADSGLYCFLVSSRNGVSMSGDFALAAKPTWAY